MKTLIIIIALTFWSYRMLAQKSGMSVEQAIEFALSNNAGIHAAANEVESQKQLRKTSFDLPKTDVILQHGQTNGYPNDNNLIVTQTIPFTALGSQASLNRSLIASSELRKAINENELVYQVKQAYYQLAYSQAHHGLLLQQDSIYEGFMKSASLRFETGETNLLEKTTAEVQRNEVQNSLRQSEADISGFKTHLRTLLNSEHNPEIQNTALKELKLNAPLDSSIFLSNPSLAYARQQTEVARSQKKFEASKFAPDLLIGFFNQTLIGTENFETGRLSTKNDRFTGIEVGLAIPLWFMPHHARVRSAEFRQRSTEENFENNLIQIRGQLQQAVQQYAKHKSSLDYYQTSALPNADLILKQSQAAFKEGEIGYTEYLMGIRNALAIKEAYLRTLNDYNQSIIYIEYLSGNK